MASKQIVLRDVAQFSDGMRGPGMRGPSASSEQPEIRVDVETLDKRDLRELQRDPEVVSIAPSMPTKLIQPTDTDGNSPATAWGISAVGADHSAFDGRGTLACVLDTGIDADHAAFAGVTLIQEDFTGEGNGDGNGHGTHCAGTVFGRDVDGMRIGVAPGVTRALIGKVLGSNGGGDSDMIFQAMQWAARERADVISMSLGFDFPGLVKALEDGGWPTELAVSNALEGYRANLRMFDALMGMIRAGGPFGVQAVVVAAAGNESRRQVHRNFEIAASLPAAAEGVVSVGALAQGGNGLTIADFSNTFPVMSAPGVGVLSAKVGGGLRSLNGTSMACPHVAGVAALWWQSIRGMGIPATADNVVAKLRATANIGAIANDQDIADYGAGLVMAP